MKKDGANLLKMAESSSFFDFHFECFWMSAIGLLLGVILWQLWALYAEMYITALMQSSQLSTVGVHWVGGLVCKGQNRMSLPFTYLQALQELQQ